MIDNLIKDLTHEYGTTTVVISHDMNSVIEIGDSIHFLHEGEVAWHGDRMDILDSGVKSLDGFVYASDLMKDIRKQLPQKMSKAPSRIPFSLPRFSEEEMNRKLDAMYGQLSQRRTVRSFSSEPVPMGVLEKAIRIAGTAPSGAHKQPWTFCVVTNAELRKRIRAKVEEEERRSYEERMSQKWLEDLEPLGTDAIKPYIEEAPALIVVFKKVHEPDKESGARHPNYYVSESCGIAVGLLLAALHEAGLATLTHHPSLP